MNQLHQRHQHNQRYGLRYPVEILLELLSAGMSFEDILADYEDVERADILAALAFATRMSQVKCMQPISTDQ